MNVTNPSWLTENGIYTYIKWMAKVEALTMLSAFGLQCRHCKKSMICAVADLECAEWRGCGLHVKSACRILEHRTMVVANDWGVVTLQTSLLLGHWCCWFHPAQEGEIESLSASKKNTYTYILFHSWCKSKDPFKSLWQFLHYFELVRYHSSDSGKRNERNPDKK